MRFDSICERKDKIRIENSMIKRKEYFSFGSQMQSLPINANLALSSMRHRMQLVFSGHQ